jgi:hypothetical protein
MVGYSGTPLPQKIGIKPGLTVFLDGAPASLAEQGVTGLTRLPRQFDVALTFHESNATLTRRFPQLIERMTTAGMIWVCWPKKASKVPTDLDDNVVRTLGLALGIVDVKVAAIDEVWSGIKFVRRLADR